MKRGKYKPKQKNEKSLKNFLIKDEVKDKKNERNKRHVVSRISKR